VRFFETVLNAQQLLSVYIDLRPLFILTDVFLLRVVYAAITVETVALDTPKNVTGFVTDAPAKRAPTICPLSKLDKSPNLPSSDTFTWTFTQQNH
jgi:hypothetical protein